MSAPFRVVAIISMFNEADVIVSCIEALNTQGVLAYVLDDGSTDESVSLVEPLVGHGVIGLERLPSDRTFSLTRILHRKEQLAIELEADWFINHDADEFRESPWPGVSLAEALERVDAAGFNAVDFMLVDFWPVQDGTLEPNASAGLCSPGAAYNSRQLRCWKRSTDPVDLASSGGHDSTFPGKRIFPLRFTLKHYPIRSAAHGARKVLQERVPRFDQEERAKGWHVQYDPAAGAPIPPADSLVTFDAVRLRMETAIEDARRADRTRSELSQQVELQCEQLDDLRGALARQQEALVATRTALADSETRLTVSDAERLRLSAERERLLADIAHLLRELETFRRSRSWRWSAPLRWLTSLLSGG